MVTIGGGLAILGALTFTILLAWYSRELPDPNKLLDRNVPQSTKIFDRTGETLLYEIHGEENRTLIQLQDLPTYVPQATVAIEDKHFYTHSGIDWKGLVRAVVVNLSKGQRIKGTSTLTQQFVRNAILTTERSYERKLKEIVLALQIERLYTKDQILQLYLNEVPYGSTMYGIESAAHGYFGKQAKDLTLDEGALLSALPQGPDLYNPYGTGSRGDNRKSLVGRQHYILDQMAEQGYVTREQAEEAKKVDTLAKLVPKKVGDIKAPHFVDYVKAQLIEKYGQVGVEQGGLKVTTSLSYDMQVIAEEEVKKGVDDRGKQYGFTNGGLAAIDPKTGHILAMVGSKDFFDEETDGQVNVTIRPRQPGSSFKPIVYAAGFLKGYTPEMTLWDVNTKFKTDLKDYEPKNYNLKENGPVSARMALQGSLNIPAVKMLYLVGVGRILDFAEQLGYSTFGDRSRFGLALVLGGGEVKLLEHVHAYSAFANEGKQASMVSILKVEDSKGEILEEWKSEDPKEVVERNVALQLTDVLSDNNARAFTFGTKNFLTLPDRAVAAKTGTTNDFHDAWTVGYTPQIAAGVWVGNMNNDEMKRGADGSVIAAPIWQAFMRRATKDMPVESFTKPAPSDTNKQILLGRAVEAKIKVDKVTGKLATAFTPPELVEERVFRDAHSELWYIDKDDPRGPAPSNPADDPQYTNWEAAVRAWAVKENWNATSTPPTETDDVHTPENQPKIVILSPSQNGTLDSRNPVISVSVTAPRLITAIEASMNGISVGSSPGSQPVFTLHIPNSVAVGYHDLTITATDDVGNRATAIVTVNLVADSAPASIYLDSPTNGSRISASSFPVTVRLVMTEPANVQGIELFQEETQTGDTRLVASESAPNGSQLNVKWNTTPPSGKYYLYGVIAAKDGSKLVGPRIMVTVE
ncbi:MAG: PBP1A family penicillin-binding protein [Patescibacteria group bacterium]|jgi:1A family penicillin-binding protein